MIATGDADVAIFPGDGTGALSDPVYSPVAAASQRVAVGDLNRDGRSDLAVTTPSKVSVLLATAPNNTFAAKVDYDATAGGIAIGDLDGDGRADLVVGKAILRGQPSGFGAAQPFDVDGPADEVQIADLNADGKPDIVTNGLVVRLNDGRTRRAARRPGRRRGDRRRRRRRPSGRGRRRRDRASRCSRTPPPAARRPPPPTTDRRALPVAYTASNAPKLRLYVKAPGANAFALAAEKASPGAAGQFDYTVAADGAFAFYTAVVDADGNEETAPATADATTQVALKRSLTAESPAFGTHTVGTIFDAFAGIVNDGEATLTLRAPQLDSPDFAIVDDQCTGATLAPGNACELRVRFSPTAAGTRSARVVFADGALDLTGEGVAPVVVPAPPPPPPPVVPQKIAATLGVAVRSTGKTQTRIRALVVNGIPAGSTVVAKLGKRTITKRNVSTRLSLAVLIKQPIKVGTKLDGHGQQAGDGHDGPHAHHAGAQEPADYDELSSSRPSSSSSTVQSPSGRGSSPSPRSRTATNTEPAAREGDGIRPGRDRLVRARERLRTAAHAKPTPAGSPAASTADRSSAARRSSQSTGRRLSGSTSDRQSSSSPW